MLALDRTTPPLSSALPESVRVTLAWDSSSAGTLIGLRNHGWRSTDVRANATYTGSFCSHGLRGGAFTLRLQSDITGEGLAETVVGSRSVDGAWTRHEFKLVPPADAKNRNNSFFLLFSPQPETTLDLT